MPRDKISEKLKLDHFKVYKQYLPTKSQRVVLKGQFDRRRLPAELERMSYFATPVRKNSSKMIDQNAHLGFYELHGRPEPRRVVLIRNQFGLQRLYLDEPRYLLVPAEKVERGSAPPKRLDHFKAYYVLQGEPLNRPATLSDQIERSERVRVARPVFFCVPVEKTHGRKTTKIQNPEGHLTFYSITPGRHEVEKTARDQFGEHKILLATSVMLGVPSLKYEFEPME